MVNVVVPISENAKSFYKILGRLNHFDSLNVHVGVCESEYDWLISQIGNDGGLFIHKYPDGTDREEMINSLQVYIESGPLLIMRKPITMDELNKFLTQNKEVVSCERDLGKFKSFLFMIWQKILKLFMGVNLYNGDSSVIYFSEEISMVLSQSGNLSYSSRVNRWKGVEQATVDVLGEKAKTSVDKKKNLIYSISILAGIIMAVLVTTLVCIFVKVGIVVGLLIACLDILALATSLILSILITFNCMVGKRHFDRAIEIQNNKETIQE